MGNSAHVAASLSSMSATKPIPSANPIMVPANARAMTFHVARASRRNTLTTPNTTQNPCSRSTRSAMKTPRPTAIPVRRLLRSHGESM